MGAARICLLGYDQQMSGGHVHWHGTHSATGNPSPEMMPTWVTRFGELYADLVSAGVEVINCTRETALNVPRMDLRACLRALRTCPSGTILPT